MAAFGSYLAVIADVDVAEDGSLAAWRASAWPLIPSKPAADFVDKILRGTKPADIPVEQRIKFDPVVNRQPPRHLGLRFQNRFCRAPTR